jgi:ABC-2 type transport system permease protein
MVSGYGIIRLGLTPTLSDLVRLIAFVILSVVYVSIWLALAMLFSVVARRSATTALATIAVWLLMTFFAGLISGVVADTMHPVKDSTNAEQVLNNARIDQDVHRFSPEELYSEATSVLLDPTARTTATVIDAAQADQALPGDLDLSDSLGIVAGQLIALLGVCAALFVATYLTFVSQEVRA